MKSQKLTFTRSFHKVSLVILLTISVTLSGCHNDVEVFYRTFDYYPLVNGDFRTYVNESMDTLTYNIGAKAEVDGKEYTTVTLDWTNPKGKDSEIQYINNKTGITTKQVTIGTRKNRYEPAISITESEIEVGSEHSYQSKVFDVTEGERTLVMTVSGESVVAGTEKVTVPAGTFEDCLRLTIVSVQKEKEGNTDVESRITTNIWYARSLGEVKREAIVEDGKGGRKVTSRQLISGAVKGRTYNL